MPAKCELLHIWCPPHLLKRACWGISGAQHVGAAGTRYFEPTAYVFELPFRGNRFPSPTTQSEYLSPLCFELFIHFGENLNERNCVWLYSRHQPAFQSRCHPCCKFGRLSFDFHRAPFRARFWPRYPWLKKELRRPVDPLLLFASPMKNLPRETKADSKS